MLTTLIAVLGTLAGATIAHLSQRAQRRAVDNRAQRTEALAAVAALATALADHRRAMWVREDLRLRGQDWDEARTASHATRSAITAPLLQVQLLLPAIAPAAQNAARAAYALRGTDTDASLRAARESAITAADDFVTAAGVALAA
ncbi:protein kilB [Streptomyces sp. NPDC047737]|uniref:protein kilB n=1 Tax=Streptomyces sp. NPDC047737 TaxID=3155740 RepID=UPI0034008B7B